MTTKKTKFNSKKFIETWMGQKVQFNRKLVSSTITTTFKWVEIDLCSNYPHVGWVVGVRWLTVGCVSYVQDEGYRYISREGRTLCVLVSLWPTMQPVRVPYSAISRYIGEIEYPGIDNATREFLCEESKGWPRDSRGRFVKGV